ncbi:hypothetical protein LguiA_006511 [Lonicera macranthoides]
MEALVEPMSCLRQPVIWTSRVALERQVTESRRWLTAQFVMETGKIIRDYKFIEDPFDWQAFTGHANVVQLWIRTQLQILKAF